jgi:uncharacterized protein with GYD domain
MATYFMFGKYTNDSIKQISAARNKKAAVLVKKCKGKINSVYALLGEHDIVLIAEFPGTKEAMKASVLLTRMLDISFTTSPAILIEELNEIVGK